MISQIKKKKLYKKIWHQNMLCWVYTIKNYGHGLCPDEAYKSVCKKINKELKKINHINATYLCYLIWRKDTGIGMLSLVRVSNTLQMSKKCLNLGKKQKKKKRKIKMKIKMTKNIENNNNTILCQRGYRRGSFHREGTKRTFKILLKG